MAKPNIEVRVEQKILSVENRKLKLEDNFEGAGVFTIGNKQDGTLLELGYRKSGDFSQFNEADRINNFLQECTIKGIDEVYSTREEDYKREVFPAVMIVGEFKAVVYRR